MQARRLGKKLLLWGLGLTLLQLGIYVVAPPPDTYGLIHLLPGFVGGVFLLTGFITWVVGAAKEPA